LAAYRAADFSVCLGELRDGASNQSLALRSRALLRLSRPDAAFAVLGSATESFRDRGEIELLRAVAASRSRKTNRSSELIAARAYAISSGDAGLEAEVEIYEAYDAVAHNNFAYAISRCLRALAIVEDAAPKQSAYGIVPFEHVVGRAHELLGVIAAAEGRYEAHIAYFRTSLDVFEASDVRDVYHLGFALRNLAIVARDFDVEVDERTISLRVDALAWTQDIAPVHFTTLEARGWSAAVRGNVVDALRSWRAASATATTDPERIIVAVNRAVVAREFGHQPQVAEEVDYALSLAERAQWDEVAGDSREALLGLAQVAASISPSHARVVLDRYTKIRKAVDHTYAARVELRARAEEAYTHGVVLRSERRDFEAAERLRFAFETWEKIGFNWRAGRAALELAELDAGDVFRRAVNRELRRRPESVFAARGRLVA
jgi:tetratricopeptide (TPR) repeat protein